MRFRLLTDPTFFGAWGFVFSGEADLVVKGEASGEVAGMRLCLGVIRLCGAKASGNIKTCLGRALLRCYLLRRLRATSDFP